MIISHTFTATSSDFQGIFFWPIYRAHFRAHFGINRQTKALHLLRFGDSRGRDEFRAQANEPVIVALGGMMDLIIEGANAVTIPFISSPFSSELRSLA
jgi:hypothetical protein